MATTTEQSLAVFYSTSPFLISQLSHHLSLAEHETGLELAAQAEFIDEELEEAGLEPEGAGQEDSKHWAVVLKGQHAVKKTRELLLGSANAGAGVSQRESLSQLFPSLKMHCSPSISAATMTISTLFPSLSSASPNASPSPSAPKPFALSNAAHPAPLVLNTKAVERQTSPSIERALKELEKQEERRLRKESGSSARSFGRVVEKEESDNEEDQEQEEEKHTGRRVFNARSADNTSEFEVFPSVEGGAAEVEVETEAIDPDQEESPTAAISDALTRQPSTSSLTSASTTTTTSRPRPSSVIQPRMTKAAALRLGIPYVPQPRRQSSAASLPSTSTVERVVPTPKSLAAPSIAPRQTKASALRLRDGSTAVIAQSSEPKRRETIGTAERAAMDKQRRASLAVVGEVEEKVNSKKLAVEVKMSRAAMLRQGLEVTVQTAAERRQSSVQENVNPAASTAGVIARRQSLSGAIRSTAAPKIVPRQNKSSALRSGTTVDPPSLSHGRSASVLEDLHEEETSSAPAPAPKRRESVVPPPPKFPVRTTKSAALRSGQPVPAAAPRPSSSLSRASSATSTREKIVVASTAQPKIAPRMSRASLLRAGVEVEPVKRRASVAAAPEVKKDAPAPRRRESIAVTSTSKPPSITPRLNRSALLRQPNTLPPSTGRPLSSISNRVTPHSSTESAPAALPSTPRKVLSSMPSIAPRSNKSAELRAAAKLADAAAPIKGGPPKLVKTAMAKGRPSTALGLTGAKSG